ncbi:MAG: M48 family metallopeptidase, partial [Bdellovibrionales bacterium]
LWYKKEARRVFTERTEFWSQITGLRPRSLTVGNPQRQWGSCSAANDIRLNWRLILAAPALLDYVIVHELCHIPHKNHSSRFWALVESFLPGCKALRRELHALDAGLTL